MTAVMQTVMQQVERAIQGQRTLKSSVSHDLRRHPLEKPCIGTLPQAVQSRVNREPRELQRNCEAKEAEFCGSL